MSGAAAAAGGFGEERFVLAALRGQEPRLQPGLSVERILALCDWHGVAPLLARALPPLRGEREERLAGGLAARRRRTAVDNLRLLSRLPALAGEIEAAGAPFALLKGAGLIPLVYAGAEERPLTDVDLLVRREDWPRVRERLVRSGRYLLPSPEREGLYTRYHQKVEIAAAEDPACQFELHWNIEIEGRTATDAGRLLERAVPVILDGRTYRRLGDADQALHLAVHAAHHATGPRLIWIHDLHRLARAGHLPWEELDTRARKDQVRMAAWYALAYLEKVHPGTVPPELLAPPAGPLRRWLLSRVATRDPILPTRDLERPPWRWLASLLLLDTPGRMGRFLAGHARRKLLLRVPSR